MTIANERILSQFVERNVCGNVTSMVEFILNQYDSRDTPFTYDDIENPYEQTEDEDDIQPQEIYEWYLVTDWLADQLAEHGEPVIRNGEICGSLWGRTCCGQMIICDGVIEQIASDLEILEGQKYDWSE